MTTLGESPQKPGWRVVGCLTNRWLRLSIVVVAMLVLVIMPSPLPGTLLTNDFQAYWGASRLLSQSSDFTDADLLLEVEQAATGFTQELPLTTWNPPWFLAWFLPFGVTGFSKASWLWFLTNLALIFASTVMLWQSFAARKRTMARLWIGLLISFLFLPTLTAVLVGQIAALVLFGVAAFLWFNKRGQPFLAGMALALTTVKPHVVYLLLALVLLELLARRNWRALAGFATPLVTGTIVALILRPSFLLDYGTLMISNRIIYHITVPTPASYLAGWWNLPWLQYAGLVALVAGVLLWRRQRRRGHICMTQLAVTTIVISLLTAPYGWSFDFILFLAPVHQVTVWAVESRIPRAQSLILSLFLIAANGLFFYQRTLHVQDKALVWFPVLMALLYGSAWWSAAKPRPTLPKVKGQVKSARSL